MIRTTIIWKTRIMYNCSELCEACVVWPGGDKVTGSLAAQSIQRNIVFVDQHQAGDEVFWQRWKSPRPTAGQQLVVVPLPARPDGAYWPEKEPEVVDKVRSAARCPYTLIKLQGPRSSQGTVGALGLAGLRSIVEGMAAGRGVPGAVDIN